MIMKDLKRFTFKSQNTTEYIERVCYLAPTPTITLRAYSSLPYRTKGTSTTDILGFNKSVIVFDFISVE
ncbi:Gamma-taxilin [Fusarium oxysporum f. sp. albedinis]|nr:Gamma-taxilin [Fusarium oxysporum f. sp. albedinis]